MYNLIIADDEKLIREGLKSIINWETHGYHIVAVAENGNQCLELIIQHKPEVCIIDIRMPGLSGLDVIKNIRSIGLETHFIILSGYQDFGYAKQALNYHADNYLLKPLDEDELIDSLGQVAKFIEAEKIKNSPVNTERMIKQYFRSYLGLSTEKLPVLNSCDVKWETYQFLLITLPREQILKLEYRFKIDNIGILLSPGSPNILLLRKYYMRSAGILDINNYLSKILNGNNYDGCIGRIVRSIDELAESLDEAEELMAKRFFSTQRGIISDLYFKMYSSTNLGKPDLGKEIDLIHKLIEVGNEHQLRIALENFSQQMVQEKHSEAGIKDMFCKLILGALTIVAIENKLPDKDLLATSDIIMEIQGCCRLSELENKIVDILLSSIDKQTLQSSDTIVKRMKFIVEKHYMDNLKLKELSSVFNYNSAYLGKIFKSGQGESFSVYLDQYRIFRSKEFLDQGYKVYQVAEKVGYAYVDYFHAKFKKYAGMAPLEYRRKKLNRK